MRLSLGTTHVRQLRRTTCGPLAPITEDTVFRIGSITKTFTAIAVMQLWERGLVDLDAPANDYLRSFRLPAAAATCGRRPCDSSSPYCWVGYLRRLSDLLQPAVGSASGAARLGAPPLAEYYRRGLPVEVEPGRSGRTATMGFAVLGQIVEEVSGQPLDNYLRDNIFDPLEMEHTDRSIRTSPTSLATGYVRAPRGLAGRRPRDPNPRAVPGCIPRRRTSLATSLTCWQGPPEYGSVLRPESVATMFRRTSSPNHACRAWVWRSS